MWKSWTANGTMRIIGEINIVPIRSGTNSSGNLTEKQDSLRLNFNFLLIFSDLFDKILTLNLAQLKHKKNAKSNINFQLTQKYAKLDDSAIMQ